MSPVQEAETRGWHGVEVFLKNDSLVDVPKCPHGPMLLFERFYHDGHPRRRFFACSAARDKKECGFFQWEGEEISEARKDAHRQILQTFGKPYSQACDTYKKLFGSLDGKPRQHCLFCHSCNILFTPEQEEKHQSHECEYFEDLSRPTRILRPRENEKTQAQYFFSRNATEFFLHLMKDCGFKNVLCVGTPRLHEEIQHQKSQGGSLDSLLLDIDHRYGQFFSSSAFCWYNMFNHFFFGVGANEKTFESFVAREKLFIVMDPPFGGLAEVLAGTVKTIWNIWRKVNSFEMDKELPIMWLFPYFMESLIKAVLPSLTMLDYKVDYDNHPHFKSKKQKGSKRGSPVRIFTNINPADVKLPAWEGYRFCDKCERYISSENVHCVKCNGCMSKDGRQYVHCDLCRKCVKPGLKHCETCGRCDAEGHSCERSVDAGACYMCGELGHKRRNCPTRFSEPPRKRTKEKKPNKSSKTVASKKKHTKELSRKAKKKKIK